LYLFYLEILKKVLNLFHAKPMPADEMTDYLIKNHALVSGDMGLGMSPDKNTSFKN
jgi:hypothetical protein